MRPPQTESGSRERVLGIFAKWPAPGTAKTRLAPDNPAWSVHVAQAFLLDTMQRLSRVAAQQVVAFSPCEKEADFQAIVPAGFVVTPQSEGNLGQRLSAFVEQQLDAGAQTVVVVGTDSPTLPPALVEQAFVELDRADVVLGPATDGGYYLVGCGRSRPPIFEGIAWSTGRVLSDTVSALADPRWRLALLPPWYDVDTPTEWTMLCGHLAALRRAGIDPGVPHIEAILWRQG
jgi:uncharacterized protein